jgi:prepilin-type N-terminal cleavage/methylation domain-containing protein
MRRNKARRGFSLVELLVVVAIIAVLMALTSAAVMRFRVTALRNTTATNLGKSRAKLGEQWKTYTDKVRQQSLNDPDPNSAICALAARQAFPGRPDSDDQVKARYLQLRQNQAFPVDFYDVFWPLTRTPQATQVGAWSAYVARLAELGITPQNESTWKNSVSPAVQSAICILMILEKGPGGSGAMADDLGPTAVGTVSLGGTATTRGVVDAWQKPVILIRQNTPGASPILTLQSAGNDGILTTPDDVLVTYP